MFGVIWITTMQSESEFHPCWQMPFLRKNVKPGLQSWWPTPSVKANGLVGLFRMLLGIGLVNLMQKISAQPFIGRSTKPIFTMNACSMRWDTVFHPFTQSMATPIWQLLSLRSEEHTSELQSRE